MLAVSLLYACSATIPPRAPASASPAASASPVTSLQTVPSGPITRLSAGSDAGHCLGYCHRAFDISAGQMQLSEFAHSNKDKYPDRKIEQPSDPATWQKLIGLADVKAFLALPERVGCPDCADGGAEWLEIQFGKVTRRVTYEPSAGLSQEAPLLAELKNLYNTLHTTGRFQDDLR